MTIPPKQYILTDNKVLLTTLQVQGIDVIEIANVDSIDQFFYANWISDGQRVVFISQGGANSLQYAFKIENKVREIGGESDTKVPNSQSLARISKVKTAEECLRLIARMATKPRFPEHLNPLTMSVNEVEPKYFLDSAGQPMLYETGVHILYGKPGTMKSWFSQQLIAKYTVRIIDLENIFSILKKRLTLLGIESENAGVFDKPIKVEALKQRINEYVLTKPDIVVFDSLSKVLSLVGAKQDNNDEINAFFTEFIDPLRNAGICVVLIDHLPKDGNSDDFPIGAQAKKQNSDVMYLFKKSKDGKGADLFLAKDREYALESRCEPGGDLLFYGRLQLEDCGGAVEVRVHPELSALIDGRSISASTAKLWFEIEDFISKKEGATKSDVRRGVQGKSGRIDDALNELVSMGYLKMIKVGSAHVYSIRKKITRG
jgi:hypothetical protein